MCLNLDHLIFPPRQKRNIIMSLGERVCLCVCTCMCVPLSPVLGASSAQDFSVLSLTSSWILLCTGHCKAKVGLCRSGKAPLLSLHWSSHPKCSGCADAGTFGSFLGNGLGGAHAHIQQEQNTDFLPQQHQGHPTQQRCETQPSACWRSSS